MHGHFALVGLPHSVSIAGCERRGDMSGPLPVAARSLPCADCRPVQPLLRARAFVADAAAALVGASAGAAAAARPCAWRGRRRRPVGATFSTPIFLPLSACLLRVVQLYRATFSGLFSPGSPTAVSGR